MVVGGRDENETNNGISHFVEHMVFKGTQTRTAVEIAESLESVGGHLNAFTGKELTCYYGHVLDEHLPRAIQVISDMLANSVYDETEMEKEKRVVLEELNAIEETPEELVHEFFWKGLFPSHPLGLPIIGSKDVISSFNKEDLVNYVGNNYSANRIVVVAAGNVDHNELVKLTSENFTPFKNAEVASYGKPEMPAAETKVIENGAIQAHICLGTHTFGYEDMRKYDLLVLNTLLGAGMSSRLFQNIREKYGLAYSVYSFVDFMFDTGMFGVYIGTDTEKIEKSIELILDELSQLQQKPVPNSELERTKSQLKGNLVLGLESTSGRMSRFGENGNIS